jgi:hypothetical protein
MERADPTLHLVRSGHHEDPVDTKQPVAKTRRPNDGQVFHHLLATTSEYSSWLPLRRAWQERRTVHISITLDPALSDLLDGVTTEYHRTSNQFAAPFREVKQDDLVLLKLARGPIMGCFTTDAVDHVEPGCRIGSDSDSGSTEQMAKASFGGRYTTILKAREVQRLRPMRIAGFDRRGWIVCRPDVAPAGDQQLALI